MALDEPPRSAQPALAVTLLAFASFLLLGLPTGLLGTAWPSMQDTFRVPIDRMGLILTASTAGYILAGVSNGQLIFRIGIWRLLAGAALIIALGLVSQALAPTWPAFLLAVFVAGFGLGIIDASMNAFFAARYPARLMNWLHACFGLGATLGPLLLTLLLQTGIRWQIAYAVGGLLQIPLAAGVLLTRSGWAYPGERGAPGATAGKSARVPLTATLRLGIVWLGMLLFFVYTGYETAAGQWTYSILFIGRGFAQAPAGFWAGAFWAAFTSGRIVLGAVVDRFGAVRMIRTGILGSLAGALLFWWNPAPAIGLVGLILLGFSQGPIFPTAMSITPRYAGQRHAANAIGLQTAACSIGIAGLPGIAGLLAGKFGLQVIAPFLIFAGLILLLVYEVLVGLSLRPSLQTRPAVSED